MHRFEAAKKTNLDEIKKIGGGGAKKLAKLPLMTLAYRLLLIHYLFYFPSCQGLKSRFISESSILEGIRTLTLKK